MSCGGLRAAKPVQRGSRGPAWASAEFFLRRACAPIFSEALPDGPRHSPLRLSDRTGLLGKLKQARWRCNSTHCKGEAPRRRSCCKESDPGTALAADDFMQCLLLLLTQARQCAALHRALAASRARGNWPPIDTRHRPTAPHYLHSHARSGQRRRPSCSCAGQRASNRPAVRHVEGDAALEAVDEDPRGPGPGKTGAVGVGARPRRRRSCCSAATAPTRAQVRPPPRRRGDAIQRRRCVDGVGFSRFGPASPVHMRWAGAHSTADTGCGRCETSVARIYDVTTKVTAGGGSPPRNRFASRRARGGHVVSTRRRFTGTTTTWARSSPSRRRSARRSSSQTRVSSDGELRRCLRVPLPSHRRDVLAGRVNAGAGAATAGWGRTPVQQALVAGVLIVPRRRVLSMGDGRLHRILRLTSPSAPAYCFYETCLSERPRRRSRRRDDRCDPLGSRGAVI